MNYGILFTAWGLAGPVMPCINSRKNMTGSNNLTYFIIIAMLLIDAILTFSAAV
jgi:hypothetical protein